MARRRSAPTPPSIQIPHPESAMRTVTKGRFVAAVLAQTPKSYPNHLYNAWKTYTERAGKKPGTYATFRTAIYHMHRNGYLERIPRHELTLEECGGHNTGWDRVWYRLTPLGRTYYVPTPLVAPPPATPRAVPAPPSPAPPRYLTLPTDPLPFPAITSRRLTRKPRGI